MKKGRKHHYPEVKVSFNMINEDESKVHYSEGERLYGKLKTGNKHHYPEGDE